MWALPAADKCCVWVGKLVVIVFHQGNECVFKSCYVGALFFGNAGHQLFEVEISRFGQAWDQPEMNSSLFA